MAKANAGFAKISHLQVLQPLLQVVIQNFTVATDCNQASARRMLTCPTKHTECVHQVALDVDGTRFAHCRAL